MICTYFLHLGFELGEVVALGDTEEPVGEVVLVDAVRRVCHADGQYCRGAIGTLSLMDVTQDGVRMGTCCHGCWIAARSLEADVLLGDVLSYINTVESTRVRM